MARRLARAAGFHLGPGGDGARPCVPALRARARAPARERNARRAGHAGHAPRSVVFLLREGGEPKYNTNINYLLVHTRAPPHARA